MLEIAAFTGALSSVTALIRVANEGKNTEMTSRLIELQQKILGMQGDFGEMQQKLFDVQQENRELKEKQRGSDDDAAFNASLTYDERTGVWSRELNGIREAYCGWCMNEGKRVRLTRGDGTKYFCQRHGYRDMTMP